MPKIIIISLSVLILTYLNTPFGAANQSTPMVAVPVLILTYLNTPFGVVKN